MCPLILNKEKKQNGQIPEQRLDPDWLQTIADHSREAQEYLATFRRESLTEAQALRCLVEEDLPALIETVERLRQESAARA